MPQTSSAPVIPLRQELMVEVQYPLSNKLRFKFTMFIKVFTYVRRQENQRPGSGHLKMLPTSRRYLCAKLLEKQQ